MERSRRSLGLNVRLLHASVACNELVEFRNGQRDLIDHWLQVQLIGTKAGFQKID